MRVRKGWIKVTNTGEGKEQKPRRSRKVDLKPMEQRMYEEGFALYCCSILCSTAKK